MRMTMLGVSHNSPSHPNMLMSIIPMIPTVLVNPIIIPIFMLRQSSEIRLKNLLTQLRDLDNKFKMRMGFETIIFKLMILIVILNLTY